MTARAAIDRVEGAVLSIGGTFKQTGTDAFRALGVCHNANRNDSLVFLYNSTRGHVGVHCHAGCDFDHVLDVLGLRPSDLYDEPLDREPDHVWPPRFPRPLPPKPEPVIFDPASPKWRPPADEWMPKWCGHRKVDEYLYLDEFERVVSGVARCEQKCFAQWRPSPRQPWRRWSLTKDEHGIAVGTVRTIPFRLPQLLAAVRDERTIWIAEGEKDVLALVAAGLAATCNAGGAGKWTPEHAAHLDGADVVIVADRDKAGRKHAEQVVATLMGTAASIEVVIAKDKDNKDAAGHLAAGHGIDEFVSVWTPKPKEPLR